MIQVFMNSNSSGFQWNKWNHWCTIVNGRDIKTYINGKIVKVKDYKKLYGYGAPGAINIQHEWVRDL